MEIELKNSLTWPGVSWQRTDNWLRQERPYHASTLRSKPVSRAAPEISARFMR